LAEETCLVLGAAGTGEAAAEEIFDNVDTAAGRGVRRRNK
jgi:hypothetical protein